MYFCYLSPLYVKAEPILPLYMAHTGVDCWDLQPSDTLVDCSHRSGGNSTTDLTKNIGLVLLPL